MIDISLRRINLPSSNLNQIAVYTCGRDIIAKDPCLTVGSLGLPQDSRLSMCGPEIDQRLVDEIRRWFTHSINISAIFYVENSVAEDDSPQIYPFGGFSPSLPPSSLKVLPNLLPFPLPFILYRCITQSTSCTFDPTLVPASQRTYTDTHHLGSWMAGLTNCGM